MVVILCGLLEWFGSCYCMVWFCSLLILLSWNPSFIFDINESHLLLKCIWKCLFIIIVLVSKCHDVSFSWVKMSFVALVQFSFHTFKRLNVASITFSKKLEWKLRFIRKQWWCKLPKEFWMNISMPPKGKAGLGFIYRIFNTKLVTK